MLRADTKTATSDISDPTTPTKGTEAASQGTIFSQILDETVQSPGTRTSLLRRLEELLGGRKALVFFTSFTYPVDIHVSDADVIESMLQGGQSSRGLTLVLNSPGGDPLAPERIVRVCRAYSNNDFEVIVPRAAKSAATMICLGANTIHMGPTSELGPVDPQFEGQSVWSVIQAYDKLVKEAVAEKGRIEPYLLQLQALPYNASQIEQWLLWYKLSTDIVIKLLQQGMCNGKTREEIERKLKKLLDPEETMSHGRPIFREEAKEMGLAIKPIDLGSDLWATLWEIYQRTDWYVSHQASKTIESVDQSFQVSAPS